MIVLDTHVLIWWVNDDQHLSKAARDTLEQARERDEQILVSVISAWEIATLLKKGRLKLAMDIDEWLAAIAALRGIEFVPLSTTVAVDSVNLPGAFHADPADRIIVALSRACNVPVVSADERIRHYPHVRCIW